MKSFKIYLQQQEKLSLSLSFDSRSKFLPSERHLSAPEKLLPALCIFASLSLFDSLFLLSTFSRSPLPVQDEFKDFLDFHSHPNSSRILWSLRFECQQLAST